MSLSATLANALSGLNVAQRALSVTANNVANANTPGYTRKVLDQEAVVLGDRGAGVQATDIARITDEFLIGEMRRQSSVVGRSEALTRYQDLLQMNFGAPGDNRDIAVQIGELQVALDARAVNPETAATAVQVIDALDQLARSLGGLADQVQVLRGQADQEIDVAVDRINADLRTIDELNDEIHLLTINGRDAAELLDRRDGLVKSLAEKIDIRTYALDSGRLAIYAAGGEVLVDNAPRTVIYQPASVVAADTVFGSIAIFQNDQLDAASGLPIDPTAGVSWSRAVSGRRSARSSPTTRSPMPTSRSPAGSAAARSPGCSRRATASCRRSATSCRNSPRASPSRSMPPTTKPARCRRRPG